LGQLDWQFAMFPPEDTSMTLRIFVLLFCLPILGVGQVATKPAISPLETEHALVSSRVLKLQGDRAADREAIRAHIDSIFQAFIKKDAAALRATHAENWLGYLEGSREMIKGIAGYMDWNQKLQDARV
jgi:hypothetical protein